VFLGASSRSPGIHIAQIKRESLDLRRKRLDKIAQRARKAGVATTSHVAWDFPPPEAIVRRAEHIRADLVIAECHQGKRLKPWLMHLTDWELLRLSAQPVLLLKNARPWREPVILAAVDPAHAHAKPAHLDDAIVESAKALNRTLKGSFEARARQLSRGIRLADGRSRHGWRDARGGLRPAKGRQQGRLRQVCRQGAHPEEPLPPARHRSFVRHSRTSHGTLGADLVVMGAVSRSGLKRVSSATPRERVLDALPCDVPGRETRAIRQPRGAFARAACESCRPQPLMPMAFEIRGRRPDTDVRTNSEDTPACHARHWRDVRTGSSLPTSCAPSTPGGAPQTTLSVGPDLPVRQSAAQAPLALDDVKRMLLGHWGTTPDRTSSTRISTASS
jgi:universal stress protein E